MRPPARPRSLQVSNGCGSTRNADGSLPNNENCLCFALIDVNDNGRDRVMRVLAYDEDLLALMRVKTALAQPEALAADAKR